MMMNKVKGNSKTRIIVLAFIVLVLVGFVVVNKNRERINQLHSEKAELMNVLHVRDSVVGDLIKAFDTIENNLTFINQRRSQLVIENQETGVSPKESLIKDIRLMNTMLEESSVKISELDKKLSESGIQLKSFKNKIAVLYKNIENQNSQIEEFKWQIQEQNEKLTLFKTKNSNLQTEILSVRDSVKIKQEIIAQKDVIIGEKVSELNKGFFALGTYKELMKNGIVLKEGGLLGIGKNKMLRNNLNEEYFTQIDISEDKTIPLNARKVNLISEHPANSYRLVEENGLITKLEIEIPTDFWKISHYAVIEVKL